jgi:hypothetical protein
MVCIMAEKISADVGHCSGCFLDGSDQGMRHVFVLIVRRIGLSAQSV